MKTTTAPLPEANRFFEEAQETIGNLFARWQDEREYENIVDYQKPLDPIAERCGVVIQSMTKQPFGCRFTVGGRTYVLMHTFSSYSYKRVA